LFSLATHPEIQDRLRSELLAVSTDSPTMGELDGLPYLDAVVRESLRYHSVVDGSIRVATKDDIIPLEKPFVGKDGKTRDVLP
jgi:cytochrome P450